MTTRPREPVRWKELEGGLPPASRSVVASAARDGADDAAVRRLGARVLPLLAAPPSLAPSPSLLLKGAGAKLLVGAALVVASGGAWLATRGASSDAVAPPPAVTSAQTAIANPSVAAQAPSLPADAPPSGDLPKPEPSSDSLGAHAPPLPALPSSEAAPTSKPSDDLRSEAELLQRARQALGSNPADALALAEEHRGRFARPALAEEREVVAIEALSRLGQTTAAHSRAETFFHAFPHSVHGSRLRARLGVAEPPP